MPSSLRIQSRSDLTQLIEQHPVLLISTYRGDWCPFCRRYLKSLNRALEQLNEPSVHAVAISIDSPEQNQTLQKRLGISLPIYTDDIRLMHTDFGVPVSNSHGKDRHLQPAVFVFKQGECVFEWKHTPKLLNLDGAIARLSVDHVISELKKHVL